MNRPEQIQLPLFIPTIQVPQGDGSILVKPGRPVSYLTPRQFAQLVGLSADTICRHVGSACLPEDFVEYIGPRKIRIRVDGLDHFREYWKGKRGSGGNLNWLPSSGVVSEAMQPDRTKLKITHQPGTVTALCLYCMEWTESWRSAASNPELV